MERELTNRPNRLQIFSEFSDLITMIVENNFGIEFLDLKGKISP